jgi:hypothetical protein
MIKNILYSALFMLIGYSSFAQSGRYVVTLHDGYCLNATTSTFTWAANPKIIVISPTGVITETNLNTATSIADVIAHEAAFNVVISDIMNQGYTTSGGGMGLLTLASQAAEQLGFTDTPCPGLTSGHGLFSVSLIPCCAP